MSEDGRGIYDDFPGYRIPSDSDRDRALQTATVVIDANVLLNLYYYNEGTRTDLLDILGRLGERLYVPHQVLREFWRNRLRVMSTRGVGIKQALEALSRQRDATTNAIDQWVRTTAVVRRVRDSLVAHVDRLYGLFRN